MTARVVRDAAVTRVESTVQNYGGVSAWAENDGVRLHSLVFGDGPIDIVVLPGITSPTPTWAFVARWLQDLGRVIVMDVRGRGLSDAPDDGYQLTDYVNDTVSVCQALNVKRPVILGHSMGARIGAAFGAANPGAASAYLLLDPPMTGPGRPYPTPWASFQQQLDAGITGTTVEEVRAFYPRWSEDELQIRVDWLATCYPRAIKETYDAFEVELFETSWAMLDIQPTLVYGGASPVVTPADLARLRDLQPLSTLLAVDGAGHMIPWDEPIAARTILRSLISPLAAVAAADSSGGSK